MTRSSMIVYNYILYRHSCRRASERAHLSMRSMSRLKGIWNPETPGPNAAHRASAKQTIFHQTVQGCDLIQKTAAKKGHIRSSILTDVGAHVRSAPCGASAWNLAAAILIMARSR